jgi:hypothetical protein
LSRSLWGWRVRQVRRSWTLLIREPQRMGSRFGDASSAASTDMGASRKGARLFSFPIFPNSSWINPSVDPLQHAQLRRMLGPHTPLPNSSCLSNDVMSGTRLDHHPGLAPNSQRSFSLLAEQPPGCADCLKRVSWRRGTYPRHNIHLGFRDTPNSGAALAALFYRNVLVRIRRPGVLRTRTDQAIVRQLFHHVRRPSRDSRNCKDRGEQVEIDSQRMVG